MRKATRYLFLFILFFTMVSFSKTEKFNANISFNKVKKQVISLVEKNQRTQALTVIENELLRNDVDYKNKLMTLKFNMMTDFLNLSAQEFYEKSAVLLLNEKRKSFNYLQQCLILEPQNLQCLWLELKYYRKYNNNIFIDKAKLYIESIQDYMQSLSVKNSLFVVLNRFDEISLKQKELIDKTIEQDFLDRFVEYNIFIKSKNFQMAKNTLNELSKRYPDYPDLIYMSLQLSRLWPENENLSESTFEKQFEVYQKKCADLPINISRKYFFDIDLCLRSL